MGTPGDEEDTHPNFAARAAALNKKVDPWLDRALQWTADSPYTPGIVIVAIVALVGLTKWWLG